MKRGPWISPWARPDTKPASGWSHRPRFLLGCRPRRPKSAERGSRTHPSSPSALRRNAPQSTNILCNSVQNYRLTTKFLNSLLDRRSLPALYYPGEGCRISHRKFWNVSFATSVIVLDTGHRSCFKSKSDAPKRTRSKASASLKTLNSRFARLGSLDRIGSFSRY